MTQNSFTEKSGLILDECGAVFHRIDSASVDELVHEILKTEKVFCVGVGGVLVALQAAVKRFNHWDLNYYVGQIDEPPSPRKIFNFRFRQRRVSLYPVAISQKAMIRGARLSTSFQSK